MPILPKREFIFKAVVSIIVVSFTFLWTYHITSDSVYVQFVEKKKPHSFAWKQEFKRPDNENKSWDNKEFLHSQDLIFLLAICT
jgi:hypothetical protein